MYKRFLGFVLGVALFLFMLSFPAPEGMNLHAWKTLACASIMIVWWIFEPVPISVTALLPLVLFPFLGISSFNEVSPFYASQAIFLFLGGFMLALALQKWNLHLRIALHIVKLTGTNADAIIAGFMIATALLSMWISNTATTVMMLPIGLSVINFLMDENESAIQGTEKQKRFFSLCLMLSIAYAANIGGTATIIGTPPNTILVGFMKEQYGIDITFSSWLLVGLPFMLTLLLICWAVLTKLVYPSKLGHLPNSQRLIENEFIRIGPISRAEKKVGIIFAFIALFWIFRSPLQSFAPNIELTDYGIAVVAIFLLFLTPIDFKKGEFLLSWKDTEKLPWGILLLFGGGIALAKTLSQTGVVDWFAAIISDLGFVSHVYLTLTAIVVVLLLTELMSNMALIAIFLPVVAALAIAYNQDPLLMAIPATLAASCAFTMPISTPPNAIVFASGHLRVHHMIRAGFILNIVTIALLMIFTYMVFIHIFSITPNIIP